MAGPIGTTANGVGPAAGGAEQAVPSGAASPPSGSVRNPALAPPVNGQVGPASPTSARGGGGSIAPVSPRRARSAAAEQLLDMLSRAPHEFDFFQVLRRLECAYRDSPRMGEASRPADETIRIGQEPSAVFAPSALSRLRPGRAGGPPWLLVYFMGLLGPNGPLPLHLTEYARDRLRNADDPTFSRFLDVFHHRMMMLLYRSWAQGQPTVGQDRPESNRFFTYVGAGIGVAPPAFRDRDKFPDSARLFYAGLFGAQTRHAAGLTAIIGEFFDMPARIEEFVGSWLELPRENRWALGLRDPGVFLGLSTIMGASVWSRQQKFRVVLGPLTRAQFRRMLPGRPSLAKLTSLVRSYTGDELRWDVRLVMDERTDEPLHLGRSHMGWTTWLGRAVGADREDLILDPQAESVMAAG